MPASLDRFTDEELLAFCRLADAIYRLGAALTRDEAKFLSILREKELWTPPNNPGE